MWGPWRPRGPWGSWRRGLAIRLIGWPALFLLGALIVKWTSLAESHVFYFPSREAFPTPADAEDVSFTTADGLTLHGWFLPPEGGVPPPWPVVLHCHGNAGNVSSHADFSSFLVEHGMSMLIFDYRGYGRSSKASRIDRHDLLIDARAALGYVRSRPDVDASRVGVLGVSLGGVFAAALAAEHPEIRAVCLVSTFSTWRGVAGDHVPLLGPLVIPSGLDPADSLARAGARPLLIVHGSNDEVVHARHAAILESSGRAAGAMTQVFMVPGMDHNGILAEQSRERRVVAEFFSRTLREGGR